MDGDRRDWIFRHYVANSLSMIPQNKYFKDTLSDWLEPKKADNRTAEEITIEVMKKTGIRRKPATE